MKYSAQWIFSLVLIALFSIIVASGCSKSDPETKLNIEITKQPEGGRIIFAVQTEFRGRLEFSEGKGLFQSAGSAEPITATLEWWWSNKTQTMDSLVKSEAITFNSRNWADTSSIYFATFGNYLVDYYWAKIKWTDKDGSQTAHELETEKALCTGYSVK